MSFTAQLGTADSQLANIELGVVAAAGNPLEPHISSSCGFTQSVVCNVIYHVSASNTLTQSELVGATGALDRTTDGFIEQEDFTSLAGWTNVGTGWTSVADPGYISWPSPRVFIDRGVEGIDVDGGGIREPHWIISSPSDWQLFADAGNGSNPVDGDGPWQIQRYSSTDRGLNWTKHGPITFNHSGSAYSAWFSFDLGGWITKVSSTYYLQVLASDTPLSGGRVPFPPYSGSVYTASSLTGTWTWIADTPALGTGADFDGETACVGIVFFDGAQWVGYYSAKEISASAWGIGRVTTTALSSPWVKDGFGQVLPSAVWDSTAMENPKVWFSTVLSQWIMMCNGNVESTEEIFLAPTEADFKTSAVVRKQIMQPSSPMYTANTLSVMSPAVNEAGDILQTADGRVAVAYAGDYQGSPPTAFEWHRLRAAYLEPWTHTAQVVNGSTPYLTKTQPQQDLIFEFQIEPHVASTSQNITFVYRITGGTSDAGSTGYALNIETNTWHAALYKLASGSFTQLGSDYVLPYRFTGDSRNSQTARFKVNLNGSTHKVYINGDLAFDTIGGGGGVSEGTYSGTLYGFRGGGGTFNIRGLTLRTADTVTVTNVPNGQVVTLRGPSGYPIDSATSAGSPVVLNLPYGHAEILEVNGHDNMFSGGIWGGDEFDMPTSIRTAFSNYIPFQTLTHTKTLGVSASNMYTLANAGVGNNVKEGINTLTFSQLATAIVAIPTSNTLVWVGNVAINVVRNISIGNNWTLSENINPINVTKHYFPANAFGWSGFVRHWKVYDLDVSNTLDLSQDIVRERFLESISNAISLSGTVAGTKVILRSLTTPIVFSQTAYSASVLSFSLSNTLTFPPERTIYIPIGNLGNTIVPNLIVTNIHTIFPGGTPTVTQGPNAKYFIAIPQSPKKVPPYCVLQVPELAITLPAPEFNDSEAYSGMFTIRRSMNGATVTYVHRLNTSKLHYDFVIGGRKMLELENYLLNYNSRIHTFTNWKGEIWYAFITNNPMEMIAKSRYTNGRGDSFDDREKVTVTLEFEGTRLN